jgi:NADPH2:quinone reductase
MEGIRVSEFGGPDVLVWSVLPEPEPGPDEVLVDVDVAGVNFIDVYHRTGLYPVSVPFTPGVEGAGVVARVGESVSDVAVGDRVAWTSRPGAYATHLALSAGDAVLVPEHIPLTTAAAVMLQGITAHYLATSTWPLEPGDRCLVHAGAGGVGGLLIQIAKLRGAEVFATAGGANKVDIATSAGADHVIDYQSEDFVAAIEATAGPRPLDVIYDGVGAATFRSGLALLRPRGMAVAFGNASGAIEPIDPLELLRHGSIYLTRPTSRDYLATREERLERTGDLFRWLEDGSLQVRIGATYPLAEAAAAHRALEGRATTGKVLLEP